MRDEYAIVIAMNIPKILIIAILLTVAGCAPDPGPPVIPPGIHVTIEAGAKAPSQDSIEQTYSSVSQCVVGYIYPPNFTIRFVVNPLPGIDTGRAVFYPDTGNIEVTIYNPEAYSVGAAGYILRHEFVHVALFYYGVVDQYTHREHASVKFNACTY